MRKSGVSGTAIVSFGLALSLFVFGMFVPLLPVRSEGANAGLAKANVSGNLPSLRGADAVKHLQANGQ